MSDWDIEQARQLYHVPGWGNTYFDINADGQMVMCAGRDNVEEGVVLTELARRLRSDGLDMPVLIRFEDILDERIDKLHQSFDAACDKFEFSGRYTAVYPIKVNQQRSVVEHIVERGGVRAGLEAGSKAELLAVIALSRPGSVIICNGYKDREYIHFALLGQLLGKRVYIVIEKPGELDTVLEEAAKLNVTPQLGVRIRLASIAKGNWQNTGGEKGKFGLTATQMLEMLSRLKKEGKSHWLKLLHFHMGSQISDLADIRLVLHEAAHYYTELHRQGMKLEVIDVGGGLGVDYEGIRSEHYYSINYHLQDYADSVVEIFRDVCNANGLKHPDVFTECGRAMTAHHAMLITEVVDSESKPDDESDINLFADLLAAKDKHSAEERLTLGEQRLRQQQRRFSERELDLAERARWERAWTAFCRHVLAQAAGAETISNLQEKLADNYFLNLSFFQSIPDVWGLDQIFPIVPLQRLNEQPDRRAVLQDLTCDSDGRIDWYAQGGRLQKTLPVHAVKADEDYLVGIFMVGAYQEILGDLHNLFGDTHAINVRLLPEGGYHLREIDPGERVDELLRDVHYDPQQMASRYHEMIANSGLPEARRKQLQALSRAVFGSYCYLQHGEEP
jgi:arginine decarboxylase